jgi:hypothetical protein
MRRPTYAELKSRVTELEDENQALKRKAGLDSRIESTSPNPVQWRRGRFPLHSLILPGKFCLVRRLNCNDL